MTIPRLASLNPTTAVPVTDTPLVPPATDTPEPMPRNTINAWLISGPEGVGLRNSPGEAGVVLLTLQGNTPLTLIGRTTDAMWLQVVLETGTVGWLPVTNVQTNYNLNTLPVTGMVQGIIPTPGPDAMVQLEAYGLRLRDAPGLTTNTLDYLDELTPLTLIGRTTDNQWLQVQTD